MILDVYRRGIPVAWGGRCAAGQREMEGERGCEDASPLDLRTKRNRDPPNRADAGHCKSSGQQPTGQLGDGQDSGERHSWVKPSEVKSMPTTTGSAHLKPPHGYPSTPVYPSGLAIPGMHLAQGGFQHVGFLDMHPRMAPSMNGGGSAQHLLGIPDDKPEIWRMQERSLCPVPNGGSSPTLCLGDHTGFQSPKALSPLGGSRDGLSPDQEPRVTHRAVQGGEAEELQGPRGVEKSQTSLPLRKRRYAVQASEETPRPVEKVPKVEGCGRGEDAPVVKEEPSGAECAFQGLHQLEPLTNGCAHPGEYSSSLADCPRAPAFYPGPPGSYLQRHLPLYPLASHALVPGPMLGLHATPYQLICPLESQMAMDIVLAAKQDEDGDTALHIAVAQGNLPAIQRLICLFLQGHKNLDTFNNLRQTPLHLAVITKQPEVVSLLVCHRASPMTLDRNGQTSVHLACEHGSLPCLRELVERPLETIDLETRNYEGFTPLHVAVASSNPDTVLCLLSQGADIDAVDIKSGRSPLTHAVENNALEMVSLLIKNGANVNSQTYSGNTALHSASGRGLLDIVRILVKNGADSSIKNYHNDTPLMVANNRKVTDILRGKASRSVPHQCSTPKVTTEMVKMLSPCSSGTSSPDSQLTPNGSSCRSPGSAPRCSPMTSHLVPPASPSRPPISTSSHSCEPKPSQGQRLSPSLANQTLEAKLERSGPLGQACSRFPNGQSDFYPGSTIICSALPPPQAVKLESGLYPTATGPHGMGFPALGHPVRYTEPPCFLVPLGNGLVDPKASARCYPHATSTGAMFPRSELLTSHVVPLASVAFSSPTVFTRLPDSATKGDPLGHTADIKSSGLGISKTCSGVESHLLPTARGQKSTKDNGQSEQPTVNGHRGER